MVMLSRFVALSVSLTRKVPLLQCVGNTCEGSAADVVCKPGTRLYSYAAEIAVLGDGHRITRAHMPVAAYWCNVAANIAAGCRKYAAV